ncbi:hypothetical protein AVEN_238181-1 [Araneus ventricosus]|uniref:Uncharacterized protein n=1 Tax=Araneus ventricosus TaxID=182803 RepID=A0A4Y2GAT9_ARAVE|nr:hypothetical protein AVEN_238181-1 [Araneus ventricosus]
MCRVLGSYPPWETCAVEEWCIHQMELKLTRGLFKNWLTYVHFSNEFLVAVELAAGGFPPTKCKCGLASPGNLPGRQLTPIY